MMDKHLVFYDGSCGFCDSIVQFLLRIDHQRKFVFAPLQGETAKKTMKTLPDTDSVVLVENYQTHPETRIRSAAVFRILWLAGGFWAIPGVLCFLPSVLFDWGYNLVAKNRHRLFKRTECVIPNPSDKERFLP